MYADIEFKKNLIVTGALYEISKSDEKKLDMYEDYPIVYKKYFFTYYGKKVMTYTMTKKTNFTFPSERYLNIIKKGYKDCDLDKEYLINETEKWCKDRAVYLAIMDSIGIIDGKDKERSEGAIPEILSNALGVSFDQAIGHDYIDDSDSRFDFYNKTEERIPWDLDYFNKITII